MYYIYESKKIFIGLFQTDIENDNTSVTSSYLQRNSNMVGLNKILSLLCHMDCTRVCSASNPWFHIKVADVQVTSHNHLEQNVLKYVIAWKLMLCYATVAEAKIWV